MPTPPDSARAFAEAELEKERRVAAPGASTVLLRGQPAAALQEYARAASYQLLAVGTRGEGRSLAVLGSVASSLARGTDIPVLLADASMDATFSFAATPGDEACRSQSLV